MPEEALAGTRLLYRGENVELLSKDLADGVFGARTHVVLLELVSDAACDTIDDVKGELALVSTAACNYREHVGIKELVEELAILTEDRGQKAISLGSLRHCGVLRLHIDDLLISLQSDTPSVLCFHRYGV